jgi:hypothetical protein
MIQDGAENLVQSLVVWDRMLSIFAGFIALLFTFQMPINSHNYHTQIQYFATAELLGIAFGALASVLLVQLILKKIETKGVYISTGLTYYLVALGLLFIFLGASMIEPIILTGMTFALYFLLPVPAIFWATRALMVGKWEKKNQKQMYITQGIVPSKIYPYPYITVN